MAASSDNGVVIGSLKASTENLGDYIQILACLRLLETLDLRPSIYLDRDTELATAPALEACSGRVLLPLNGWFKRTVGSDPQWPPHERIIPVFIGFHVRPHQCPALLEQRSIDYMKAHGPVEVIAIDVVLTGILVTAPISTSSVPIEMQRRTSTGGSGIVNCIVDTSRWRFRTDTLTD